MTGKTFEESQKIREQIEKALAVGMKTPSQVAEWMGKEAPSIATISRIMREEMGYQRTESEWKKGK